MKISLVKRPHISILEGKVRQDNQENAKSADGRTGQEPVRRRRIRGEPNGRIAYGVGPRGGDCLYDRRIGTDVPVFAGAKDALPTVLTARLMVIQVSTSYRLSGMDVKRRIVLNLVIITVAVSVSYAIGLAAKQIWGITV